MRFQIILTLLIVILVEESSATIESSEVVANPSFGSSYPFAISLFNRKWDGYKVQNSWITVNAVYHGLANFQVTPQGDRFSNKMDFYFQTPYSGYPVCHVQFESAVVLVNIFANTDYITVRVYNPDGSEKPWYTISSRIHITCQGSLDPYVYSTSDIGLAVKRDHHAWPGTITTTTDLRKRAARNKKK